MDGSTPLSAAAASGQSGSQVENQHGTTQHCPLDWMAYPMHTSKADNFGVIVLNGIASSSPLVGFAASAAVIIAADGAAAAFVNSASCGAHAACGGKSQVALYRRQYNLRNHSRCSGGRHGFRHTGAA